MRRFRWTIGALLALISAGSASATVTIDHVLVGSQTVFAPGDEFQVEVRASWDGQGDLEGIFSSTGIVAGDPADVVAVSAVSGANFYRGSLFDFTDPDTGDLTTLDRYNQNWLRQAVDPIRTARSVQYGSITFQPIDPRGAASNVLITTITYRIVAIASYTVTIGTVLLLGDTGPIGDVTGNGSTATVVVYWEPEPRTALLLGMGLAGLAARRGTA